MVESPILKRNVINTIDPIIPLASSIQSAKGTYALLVGSGVSRSAGIPTGWEVTLDLIRKVALLSNDDCEPDPAAWYAKKFGDQPNYSQLLDSIAKSAIERNQLLKGYFEPSEADRELGLKIPTAAHKAIASLASKGYVRVILTTNFDRLVETALESAGVTPTVISTPDAVEGALPLIHVGCCVIKVNGDYLDTRIRNTEAELETYDDRMNGLIDRVLDEYGLLVCGWSGEWDTALRAAIERCKSHRFTTYWVLRAPPSDTVRNLLTLRRAQTIQIKDADSFYQDLEAKVSALDEFSESHPVSTKIAVARLKKYVVNDADRIRLRDLTVAETERLYSDLRGESFSNRNARSSAEVVKLRMKQYEKLAEPLLALLVHGCYWGRGEYSTRLWVDSLERIASTSDSNGENVVLDRLRMYPAFLLSYGAGVSCIAVERYDTLASVLHRPHVQRGKKRPALPYALISGTILSREVARLVFETDYYTPLSERVYKLLREPLREYIQDDDRYEECFDRFECILALVQEGLFGPTCLQLGRFAWKEYSDGRSPLDQLCNEAAPGSGAVCGRAHP